MCKLTKDFCLGGRLLSEGGVGSNLGTSGMDRRWLCFVGWFVSVPFQGRGFGWSWVLPFCGSCAQD